jgi:hypothetical protein
MTHDFFGMVQNLGIDLGAMVDRRTEMSFATAHQRCRSCAAHDRCRELLGRREVHLSELAEFCPAADLFVDLLYRQPTPPDIGPLQA